MKILSHRGYWQVSHEKNSVEAFQRAVDGGFGVELDVRDCAGSLVISHDMPQGGELSLLEFLKIYDHSDLPIAFNIKSDGLAVSFNKIIQASEITNFFVFDMSVPDMRHYLNEKIPVFGRMSEVEKNLPWEDQLAGVWLDSFFDTWYTAELINDLLNKNLRVCVVSSELHQRDHQALWRMLLPMSGREGLSLCTDFPEDAANFFGLKK